MLKQRTRSRGQFGTSPWSYTDVITKKSDGTVTYGVNHNASGDTPNASGTFESMTDMVSSNFGKVQAEGRIRNNPMSKSRVTYSGSCSGYEMTAHNTTKLQTATFIGDAVLRGFGMPSRPADDASLIDDLRTLAATSARAGVESPEAQGMVFVAELRKTLNMLRNPLMGLQKFVKNRRSWEYHRIRGLRRVQAASNRKTKQSVIDGASALSDSWLEARFGWRPFLMEMDKILKELFKENSVPRKTSRGSQSRTVTSTAQSTLSAPNGVTITFHTETVSEYKVRSGILYDCTMDLRDSLGFRWQDIPSTMYELIPFSFVVDWFANVGTFISSMTPRVGVRHLAEFETITVKHTVTRVPISMRFSSPWTVTSHPQGVQIAVFETQRRVPRVSASGIVIETDIIHALRNNRTFDAAALIHKLFLSPKKKAKR